MRRPAAPIPEAIVQMSMPAFMETLPTTPKGRVMADSEGRFFFADLPAGDYYLGAQREGYPASAYGQRRASGQTQPLTLREGERRADVRLQMWKYAVIAGRVVDEAGEPVVGVAVRALIKGLTAGRPTFGTGSISCRASSPTIAARSGSRTSRPAPTSSLRPPRTPAFPVATMTTMDAVPRCGCELADRRFLRNVAARATAHAAGRRHRADDGEQRADSTAAVGDGTHGGLPDDVLPRLRLLLGAATQITLGAGEERSDVAITLRPVLAVRGVGTYSRHARRIGTAADDDPSQRRVHGGRRHGDGAERIGGGRVRDRHRLQRFRRGGSRCSACRRATTS